MGKIEKWHLLPSYYKYLDKSFIEMFLSSFLSAVYILVDLGHMTKMAAMPIYGKKPFKNLVLQNKWADSNEFFYVA